MLIYCLNYLYAVAFIRLLPIISRFGSTLSNLKSYGPSVDLLNKEINKLEKYSESDFKKDRSNLDNLSFTKDIIIDSIDFKYGDGDKFIFKTFLYKIKKVDQLLF